MTDDFADLGEPDVPEDDPGQATLFGSDEEFHSTWREWVGMPEFSLREIRPHASVMVHFATEADLVAFRVLVGQDFPVPSLRGIWYPRQEITRMVDKRYRHVDSEVPDSAPGYRVDPKSLP